MHTHDLDWIGVKEIALDEVYKIMGKESEELFDV